MEVRIIRSMKRRKTVEARQVDGTLEVRAPAGMSDEELEPVIETLRKRVERRMTKSRLSDDDLETRARVLNGRYFDGLLRWESVRWVTNQNTRHGSCSPVRGTIRISHRLARMPRFVQDYVLIHELAHLIETGHGRRFREIVSRYPMAERARGYLMAVGLEDGAGKRRRPPSPGGDLDA